MRAALVNADIVNAQHSTQIEQDSAARINFEKQLDALTTENTQLRETIARLETNQTTVAAPDNNSLNGVFDPFNENMLDSPADSLMPLATMVQPEKCFDLLIEENEHSPEVYECQDPGQLRKLPQPRQDPRPSSESRSISIWCERIPPSWL